MSKNEFVLSMVPEVQQIEKWLIELDRKPVYPERNQLTLCFPMLEPVDGVYDLEIICQHEVVLFSLVAELKPSSILFLLTDLNQINGSLQFSKVFIEMSDHELPRLIMNYSLAVDAGLTFDQFKTCLNYIDLEAGVLTKSLSERGMLISHEFLDDALANSPEERKVH